MAAEKLVIANDCRINGADYVAGETVATRDGEKIRVSRDAEQKGLTVGHVVARLRRRLIVTADAFRKTDESNSPGRKPGDEPSSART